MVRKVKILEFLLCVKFARIRLFALKCCSLSIAKTSWRRRERGCAEDSGISFASVVGHWNRLRLQKSQMGYYLCLLDLVELLSKRFRILIHC